MIPWADLKINVRKHIDKKPNPFDWKEPSFPRCPNIEIIVYNNFSEVISEILKRVFATADIELTDKILKKITRIENPKYAILFYQDRFLGFVYLKEDLFSKIVCFTTDASLLP